jgi:hypothetical protein
MDRASQVLAQGVPDGVPNSYRALADYHGGVDHTTLICLPLLEIFDSHAKRPPVYRLNATWARETPSAG